MAWEMDLAASARGSDRGETAAMSLSALPSGREGRSPAPLSPSRLVIYFLILVAWVAYAPKIVPYRGSDRGIFVSVAERLLAGDILYKDVLDNKEPLFYYFVALERIFGAYGEILGEFVLLVIASYSVYRLASISDCGGIMRRLRLFRR
jgi:hypothetical protein